MRKKEKQDLENAGVSKNKINRKRIMTYFAYLSIVAVTVVVSLYNVGFDFAKIKWDRFASDLLIGYALTTILLMVSIGDGENRFQEQEKGRFFKYLTLFHQKVDELVNYALTGFFVEYAHERIYEDAKRIRISKKLTQVGIHDIHYIDLTIAQLKNLANGIPLETTLPNDTSGKQHFFDEITQAQFDRIMSIKNGEFYYKEIPANWFTNDFRASEGDQYEWMADSDEHIRKFKAKAIAYRMAMLGITLALFSAVFIHPYDSTQQMVVNLVTRVATSVMAIVFGYMIAGMTVDMRADVMSFKVTNINYFLGDYRNETFKPIRVEDRIMKKIALIKEEEDKKKHAREEEEKLLKSLETPILEPMKPETVIDAKKDDKPSNSDIEKSLGEKLASVVSK